MEYELARERHRELLEQAERHRLLRQAAEQDDRRLRPVRRVLESRRPS